SARASHWSAGITTSQRRSIELYRCDCDLKARRFACPCRAILPVDAISTDVAAKPAFPVERADIPITFNGQSAAVAFLVSGFEAPSGGNNFRTLVRITVHVPRSGEVTPPKFLTRSLDNRFTGKA